MNNFNNIIKNVSWTLSQLPSEAQMYKVYEDNYESLSDNILNLQLPYSSITKKIEVLHLNGKTILTTPFNGTTFRQWMNSLYEGLHKPIKTEDLTSEQLTDMYVLASRFIRKEDRELLIHKLENNELKPIELSGDYIYFEGNLRRKNNTWVYAIGS